jgi:hypothetical protein
MGTVTHRGWYTSEDEIPQPTSIIMGGNLRTPAPERPAVPEDPPASDRAQSRTNDPDRPEP